MDFEALPQTSCDCERCKSMCYTRPCWGTPAEVRRLIEAGHETALMIDWWEGDDKSVELLTPAIDGYQGKGAPYWPEGKCAMLDADDHCILHGAELKPIEGRVVSCSSETPANLHTEIALSWDTDEGRALVSEWRGRNNVKCTQQSPADFVGEYIAVGSDEAAMDILMNYTPFPFGDIATIRACLSRIKEVGFERAVMESEKAYDAARQTGGK